MKSQLPSSECSRDNAIHLISAIYSVKFYSHIDEAFKLPTASFDRLASWSQESRSNWSNPVKVKQQLQLRLQLVTSPLESAAVDARHTKQIHKSSVVQWQGMDYIRRLEHCKHA